MASILGAVLCGIGLGIVFSNNGSMGGTDMNLDNFNITDAVVLLLLLICMLNCYKRGLVLSLFRLCSSVLSLLLGWKLYPIVSKVLRGSDAIYGGLKGFINHSLNLDGIMQEQTLEAQTKLIDSLHLPDFLLRGLVDNNNPVLYNVLHVDQINDYIVSYLANVCINVLSFSCKTPACNSENIFFCSHFCCKFKR